MNQTTIQDIPYFNRLRGRLLVFLLFISIIPASVLTLYLINNTKEEMINGVYNELLAVRDMKSNNIARLIYHDWSVDVIDVSSDRDIIPDMLVLEKEMNKNNYTSKNERARSLKKNQAFYSAYMNQYDFFSYYTRIHGYGNAFILSRKGDILYSNDFSAHVGDNIYDDSNLYQGLVNVTTKLKKTSANDFAISDVLIFEDEPAIFVGSPIEYNGGIRGFLVYTAPWSIINGIMEERSGLGTTGESYLIGYDFLSRSDVVGDPSHRSVLASYKGNVFNNGVNTEATRLALRGKSGTGIYKNYNGIRVLTAYKPLKINGLDWAILVEIQEKEVLANIERTFSFMHTIILILFGAIIFINIFVSNFFSKPIVHISQVAQKIASGDLSVQVRDGGKTEIGYLSSIMNSMIQTLRSNKQEREKEQWIKTGQSDLDDLMRGDKRIQNLTNEILVYIAEYINAHIGAFYLRVDNEEYTLYSTYAYTMRKQNQTTYQNGEGLVGQCALEKQTIVLSDVPPEYITVSSGLGYAPPKMIVLVPCIYNDIVEAVIEFGSLISFNQRDITLLESVSERIAITINTARGRKKLKDALVVSSQQAEELQTQQEELRVTNEELEEQAKLLKDSQKRLREQQEELQVTNEELEEKTLYLEEQKKQIENANLELNKKQVELTRKAEELQQASKYKSEFLANMSHELRTPLNSLLILAEQLGRNRGGNLSADEIESARVIYESGTNLLSLINEILDLSKIEAGHLEIFIEKTPVESLIKAFVPQFMPVANKKGLKFKIEIAEGIPADIYTDGKRLQQIIRNLLSNALKFTAKGSVVLRVFRPNSSVTYQNKHFTTENIIGISVRDTGIGIREDKLNDIFAAFNQVDGSITRKYGGTGLGLSITRELIQLLGGEISVESVLDKGSTFTIYHPVKPAAATSAEPQERRENGQDLKPEEIVVEVPKIKPLKNGKPPKANPPMNDVLIIEDDESFASVLKENCTKAGLHGILVNSGEEGLKKLSEITPVAILLDIYLPGINGWQVLEAIKVNPETRHIPVHILSVDDTKYDALSKGAVGFIKKPLDVDQLKSLFTNIISHNASDVRHLALVSGNEDERIKVEKLLKGSKAEIIHLKSGKTAIEFLSGKKTDCIIMDTTLSDMDGIEFLKQLKEKVEDSIPPIIVYTEKKLSKKEKEAYQKHSQSIILKGKKSEDRLIDEVTLFLHQVFSELPINIQDIINESHLNDIHLKNKRVLITEDDMRTAFAMSKALEEYGMITFKAENGIKALQTLKAEPNMDLILMDIMMPEMNGYECIREIRKTSATKDVPIIALTAKAMKEDREKCIDAGASDYLSKPVDINLLLSVMKVWVQKK